MITGRPMFSFANIRSIDPGWRYFTPAFFVNDDFKLTQQLTLNLGVRYDIPYPRTEAHDRYRIFIPTARNPVVGRPEVDVVPGRVAHGRPHGRQHPPVGRVPEDRQVRGRPP